MTVHKNLFKGAFICVMKLAGFDVVSFVNEQRYVKTLV